MNKRRKILAAMLAAFMLLVPMVSTAQIDIKGEMGEETSNLSGTWGTTQITDYQTEEYVPLGEGLWLLAGAAGLYLLVKSRKTRKATAVAAAALALTLGTTQCKKTEESVIPAGETISISFMAGNGAKSDIDVTTGRITWEDNDEVYVVYGGQLLSETPLLATPDDNPVNASISGTITTAVTIGANPSFTFYYVGSGVTFDKEEFTFDITNQDGIHAGHYMVGRTEAVEMKKDQTSGKYGPVDPGAKHFDPLTSVLRLNTSEFGANQSLTMDGGNSEMTIDLTNPETPSYTPGYITFTSGEDVQISVIPTTTDNANVNATLDFWGNGMEGSITVTNGIKEGRIYSKVINNAGFPIHVEAIESGILPGLFSVSADKQVRFSKGNLQYQATTKTWRFAENQWNFVGNDSNGNVYENGEKCSNKSIAETYSGWIDLFGWATSGQAHGGKHPDPWDHGTTGNWYAYSENNSNYDLNEQTGKADWGYNAISNGLNKEQSGWRTLSKDEWNYLFYHNTWGFGRINGSNGIIILPDGHDPDIFDGFKDASTDENKTWDANIYTYETWQVMDANGAVFLPAAGYRSGTTIYMLNECHYWSTRHFDANNAHRLWFQEDPSTPSAFYYANQTMNRWKGASVRLVKNDN